MEIWYSSIYPLFFFFQHVSACSFMSACNKWEQKTEIFPLRSSMSIDFSFATMSPYIAHPFLTAVRMLGRDWFIAGFLHPNTPCGIYLVHAKLKLIHIWANQHLIPLCSCDLCVLIDPSLSLQREGLWGLHNCVNFCALTQGEVGVG